MHGVAFHDSIGRAGCFLFRQYAYVHIGGDFDACLTSGPRVFALNKGCYRDMHSVWDVTGVTGDVTGTCTQF